MVHCMLFLMMGCTDKKVEIKTEHLQHEILDVPDILIGSPVGILKDGDNLIVLDYQHDSLFHRVDLAHNLYMGMFGAKGQGPDEFIYPSSLNRLDNGCFSCYDVGKRELSRICLETDGDEVAYSRLFKYAQMQTFDIVPLSDCLFIVNGVMDGAMFSLIDNEGNVLSLSDEYPYKDDEEKNIPVRLRAMAYQGTLRVNSKDYFAYVTSSAKQVHLYKVEDGMIRKTGEIIDGYAHYKPDMNREGAYSVTHDGKFPECYIDLSVTDNYVYALYSGRTFSKYKLSVYEGETIFVFDWTGNLLKVYQLDVAVKKLCVDEDKQVIYAVANIPEPTIVRFNLD